MELDKIVQLINTNKVDKLRDTLYNKIDTIKELFDSYIKNHDELIKYRHGFSSKRLKNLVDDYDKNNKMHQISLIRYSILKCLRECVLVKVDSKKEFNNEKRDDTQYHLVVGKTDKEVKSFLLYTLVYYLESALRIKHEKGPNRLCFVGIDYEFTKQVISLMQLNFENMMSNRKTTNYMFIINPGEFTKPQVKILIDTVMRNRNLFKIFHGADSLDVPYTFNELFSGEKNTILDFTDKFVDTRFLCEYLRNSIGEEKKCTIYEALKYFDTISDSKLDFLNKTHDLMGPVQDEAWNVHKLSSFHTKYAFYDVIYLRKFLRDIYTRAKTNTKDGFKFYRYLNALGRFVLLERRDVTDITSEIKKEVDPINNYLIRYQHKNITLITIYNEVIKNIKIPAIAFDIDNVMGVNYFKMHMTLVLKKMVYSIITNKYKVYKNKHEKIKHKIPIDDLFHKVAKYKLKKIMHLFKLIYLELKRKIDTLYRISLR